MKLSDERILTTHVGSLPRANKELHELLYAIDRGEDCDRNRFEQLANTAVTDVCTKQVAAGIDVISDGEQSKIGYSSYIRHRISGFETAELPGIAPPDVAEFPEFALATYEAGNAPDFAQSVCTGPIETLNSELAEKDIATFQGAITSTGANEGFMPAASPGVISVFQPNKYYATDEEYLFALADAMKPEYDAIAAAGLVLQLDCPDLALGRHIFLGDMSDAEFAKRCEIHVEALNHALRDIQAENVRMHLCWGNYDGPHHHDIPVRQIIPLLNKAKPLAVSFEASNPRHEHEWKEWRDAKVRDNMVLIPGVIDSHSNYVEHPEVVADRIMHYTDIVGRERVIAGSDCGYGTFASLHFTHPAIVWPKLKGLAEGAALASSRLF
jgi:5-methyltetrahydropteroyltriglutamate--homocysteine methyltransferase